MKQSRVQKVIKAIKKIGFRTGLKEKPVGRPSARAKLDTAAEKNFFGK